MIPKIIHYCWFGRKDLSVLAKSCIKSWRKFCPDHQIIEWNEDNFDIDSCDFVREAYLTKKWAFVSDYARLWILRRYGGVYMDTDVELIRGIDRFLDHRAFSGHELPNIIPTGIIGAEPDNAWVSYLLSYYSGRHFIKMNGMCDLTPNVRFITKMTSERYHYQPNNSFCDLGDVVIYPKDHFCPKSSADAEILITDNTYAIHHFNSSWVPMGRDEKNKERSIRNRMHNIRIRLDRKVSAK